MEHTLHPLLSQEKIASLVKRLADQISQDYQGGEIVLVCILKGAFVFVSDLIRLLRMPVQVDFVRLASYGTGMQTSGNIRITKDIEIAVDGKDVLIVEDIIDSGRTLLFLKDRMRPLRPRSVKVCALLDKKARREVEVEADYLGTEVDDIFIVGYGIDFNEAYRNLPEIYYVTLSDSQKS
jgi:hypoxanthine phosphoribosyltransferase